MKGRKSAASKLLIATILSMLLLSTSGTRAHAFTNGQSASLVIGQKDFTSGGSAISQSGLAAPVQVVFDSSGNLWVADLNNARVLEFKPPFSTGMQASLVIGQPEFTTRTYATTQSGFSGDAGPRGLGFDSSGNLWVADHFNSRVLEFKPPFANGMNASLVIGQKDFTTAIPGGSKDGLSRPAGVAFDHSGNLWVFDGLNSRILGFTPPFSNGMNASLVIGQHDFESRTASTTQSGLGLADADSGGSLAIDSSGNIWVADGHANRVLEFKPPFSNGMNASLVIGQPDFVTKTPFQCCGPQNTIGRTGFANPSAAVDPAGNLWVSDFSNNRLLEFQPPFSNGMAASLVIGQQDFTTGNSSTTMNGLSSPEQVGFDSSGNLWAVDHANNRVLEFSSSTSSVTSTTSPTAQSTTTSSTTSIQSSQTSVTSTTTTTTTSQALGQLPYIAAGAAIVVVGVGLTAVFLLRSRRRRGAA